MLSVIVPAYNEEHTIKEMLVSLHNALDGVVNYEIVVVDDGSTDGTLDRIKKRHYENLTIISHPENLGYGKALFDGILKSKYDCIAIIDADSSYNASDISQLYQYYPKYDMVVGARTGKEYRQGLFKRPARFLFNALAEYATGRKIPDVNSGLRIFRRDVILNHRMDVCTGFSFTTTITLIFMLNSYFVKYIPIRYNPRKGKSKVRPFRDTLRAAQIIVQAILHHNPVKLFLLIAFLNSFFGALLGLLNHHFMKLPFLTWVSVICVASFVPVFCLGLFADQLRKLNLSKLQNN